METFLAVKTFIFQEKWLSKYASLRKIVSFYLIFSSAKFVETHSFHYSSETLRKLCGSIKFSHREIR